MTLALAGSLTRAHAWLDDVQGILTGALLGSIAIVLFRQAGLVPGGTVGLALLLEAASPLPLSACLLLANLPFYLLAAFAVGPGFTARTLATVLLTAALVHWLPDGVAIRAESPFAAAVVGGALCGLGILVLLRHGSSMGGLNILLVYFQRRTGWPQVRLQWCADLAIVGAGAWMQGDAKSALASLLAVSVLNAVLAMNHRPGRYVAAGR